MAAKVRKPQQSFTNLATLEQLLEVGQSLIVVRDLKPLLRKIARTAGSVLGADVVVLYEYQEETDDISVPPVVWGKVRDPQVLKEKGRKRPHRDSAVFKMLRRTRPFYARNAREDWTKVIEAWSQPKEWSKSFIYREGIVSSAAVPLTVNKKKVGVLFVNYRTPRTFHAEERRIIELFATQAAIAIHNADLFTQERQRAADMDLLRRVSATISAALDIKKSLVLIAKGAVQLTRTEGTSVIHLFDEAGQGISDSYEFPESFGLISSRFSEKKGLTWDVFKTGQIVEIADVSKSKRASQALADSKTKSVIGVPLKLKGRIIGALFLNSLRQHKFTDDEKVILTLLAEQAAIALQNARRLQQEYTLRQQAERLRKVSSAISSNLDLEKVAGRILDELGKVVAYRKASMQLIQGDERKLLAHRGFGEESVDEWLLRPISQDRLISRVVENKRPLILSEPSKDTNWEIRSETANVKSWVGLPLVYAEETIGLLTLDHDQPGFYTPAIEGLLVSFANQAAIAINNTQLVQRLRERADQISLLQQIGARINSTMKLDEILQLLVKGAIRLTGTTSGVVHIFNSSYGEAIGSYGYPKKFDHPSPRISEGGYTSLIIQKKEQQVVQNTLVDDRVNPDIRKKGVKSFAGTPLILAEERVVGVLYVNDTSVHQFTSEELSLLRALADQAAIAVENASLLGETTQRAEGIAFANRLGRALSATRDIEEIPRLLVKETLKAFNAEAGSLALINAETQEIEFQFALDYRGTEKSDEVMKGYKMPLDKGIAGAVVKSRTPVISNDVQHDPRWHAEVDSVTGFTTKSILAVPLIYGDLAIGVIEILNKRDGSPFLEREKDVLTTLALSAAIAIENARLYAQRAKDIIALEEINAAITTESRENISALIARKAKELTQADYSGLWLVDENHLVLGSMYGASPLKAPELLIDGKSINGWVAKTGKPYKCFDVNNDPHYRMWREEIQSSVAVPLKVGAKVTGTLSVESARPNAFSDYQLKLLQSLADQAAIAIENARLFKETDERTTQLEQLQEITRAISSESTDVEKVLRLIVDNLSNVFGGASCAIRLFDSGKAEFGRWVGAGALKDWWDHAPRPGGTSWYVVKDNIPFYVEDTSATPPEGQPAVRKEAIDKGVKAIAYLPLVSKGRNIGILYVNLLVIHRFSQNEKRMLELFAHQAAITIENARMYEERSKDIAALQEINEAVVSRKLEDILQLVVDKAIEVLPGEHGELWLKEQEIGDLVLEAVAGLGKEAAKKVKRIKAGITSINMQVAQTGQPYICRDALCEPGFLRIYEAAQSSVTVPLKYQNTVIGTLNVESSRLDAFTGRHCQLLVSFADQATIALQNATLFQQERQRADALGLLREVSGEISAQLDLDATLERIVEGAMRLTGTSSGVVHLVDEASQSILRSVRVPEDFHHPVPRFAEKRGMTWEIADKKQMIVVPDAMQDERVGQATKERGVRSLVGVPLKFQDKITGVLYLNSNQPRQFTSVEQSLLLTLADQAAIAIENARLFQEVKERVSDLGALSSISHGLGSKEPMTISAMSQLLYEAARGLMDLKNYYVARYDKHTDLVTFDFVVEDGKLLETRSGEWLPRAHGNGLTEHVIHTAQFLYIGSNVRKWRKEHQVYQGLRGGVAWSPQPETEDAGSDEKCWLGVPIKVGDEVLGVIGVQNFVATNVYDEHDTEVLSTIAAQLGIAIVRQRLDQKNRELEVLPGIYEKIVAVGIENIDRILDLVYQEASKVMDLSNAQVQFAFYDKTKDEVSFPLAIEQDNGQTIDVVRWSKREAMYQTPGEDETVEQFQPRVRREPPGLTEYGIRTKQPLLIVENFKQKATELGIKVWDTFGRLDRPTHSWLGVPMIVAGRVIGTISMLSLEEHAFDQSRLELLATVANQAAIAIENARLYEQQQRKVQELQVLTEMSRGAISNLGIDQILDLVYEQTAMIMDLSDAQVQFAFYEEAKGEVSFPLAVEQDDGRTIDVVRWGKREAQYRKEDKDEVVKQFVPRARREPPHLFSVGLDFVGELDRCEVSARLREQFQEHGKALTQQAWVEVEQAGSNWTIVDADEKYFIQRENQTLNVYEPPGLTEYVIRTKKPLLITESFEQKATALGIRVWPSFGRLERPTHSWLGVPMMVAGRVIGVISIQSLELERAFGEGDLELLATVANQAAVAIENAALFEAKDQTLRALREEQRKNIAAGRLAAVNAMAAGFVHKLNNLAGTIPVRVGQIKELLDPNDPKYNLLIDYLNSINADADGILKTAQAIRSSTAATETLELVHLDILVSTAVQRIAAPSGIEIRNQCGTDLPLVLAFSGQLVDTLENLVRNGIDAIDGPGSVTIASKTGMIDSQEGVVLGIEDTGRGIPPDDLPRIFDLFFTTKDGGMGFGLWRAKTLIESLGGKIEVVSKVGSGTTFTIAMPVAKEV